ncbi:MAG: ribonuclease HII [Alphaproteobacteria bacterium]|nr:ribonuclease HII [Alphaproteobacteria bacterium]
MTPETAALPALTAGVDEAGRGPWAGPVVAAAVILTPDSEALLRAAGVDDSKALTRARRERCFDLIHDQAARGGLWFAIEAADVGEIDTHNILQASLRAMSRAVAGLPLRAEHALVDGNRRPDLDCPCDAIVGGDGKVLSISAASILAKVARDRLMADLAARHPGYGWERNAGYGTAEHRRALESLGVTEHHRRSFAPIRALLESDTISS